MTEFQELQIKHTYAIANMLCVISKENESIINALYKKDDAEQFIKQINDEMNRYYKDLNNALKDYYKDKAGE